jgi:hypothetical protein
MNMFIHLCTHFMCFKRYVTRLSRVYQITCFVAIDSLTLSLLMPCIQGINNRMVRFQKLTKTSVSHYTRVKRTPSAAATVQVSHALPAVRFSCLLRGHGASFQDGIAAATGFLCASFWGVQICDYSAAKRYQQFWTVYETHAALHLRLATLNDRHFLFSAQCFNAESMQKVILWHSCV